MKVLVVSSKFHPEYAGSALRAARTYQRLQRRYGVEYFVLCNGVQFTEPAEYQWEGAAVKRVCSPGWMIDNARYNEISQKIKRNIKYYQEFLQTIRWLRRRKFDAVHIFGKSASTAAAAHFSRWAAKPLILELCNNMTDPSPFVPFFRTVSRADLRKGTVIVAISEELAQMCGKHGYEANVWSRPNPIDESRFYFRASSEGMSRTCFSAEDKVLVYIAKFWPQKNHIFLLEVLARLPEKYKLVLAGPLIPSGANAARDTLTVAAIKNRIAELGLAGRVELITEYVESERYIGGADVYLFPASNEALGTPLLESLACGVPVIANSDEKAFQQWLENGINGFLCPLEAGKWAEAVLETEKFSLRSRQDFSSKILSQASSQVIDKQYFQILQSLVSSSQLYPVSVEQLLGQP